jgi:CubicO group peptidase (beta-lactamase class C family)
MILALAASLALQVQPVDISDALKTLRDKNDLPGLVALAVQGDRVAAQGAAGVRKRGADAPITVEDRVHIGSCTKSMTATLIAILVGQQKLAWTTTVGEAFPRLKESMHPDWRGVTLEQLLTHRGGAPANLDADGLWGRLWSHKGSPTEQRLALVEGVVRRKPETKPGGQYTYSNAGFAVAGAIAESAMGEPWENLMEGRIFKPLGMASAGFGPPGSKDSLDQPRGHDGEGRPVEPGPGADNPTAIGPAGTVHCSLGDWAKYAFVHARMDANGSKMAPRGAEGFLKFLKPAAFEKLHTPASGGEPRYAMGWIVADRDWADGPVLTHAGSNTMWFAVVWLAPKRDLALLAATNQAGDKAAAACDAAIVELLRAVQKK